MFQLNLPFRRQSKTTGRGSSRTKKRRLFGSNIIMPCVFCNIKLTFDYATIDHIIPHSKGGPNIIENLTISCMDCNSNRGSVSFDDWKKIGLYYKIIRALKKSERIIGRCLVG